MATTLGQRFRLEDPRQEGAHVRGKKHVKTQCWRTGTLVPTNTTRTQVLTHGVHQFTKKDGPKKCA